MENATIATADLIPLLVAAGAAGDSNGRKVFSDRVMHTPILQS